MFAGYRRPNDAKKGRSWMATKQDAQCSIHTLSLLISSPPETAPPLAPKPLAKPTHYATRSRPPVALPRPPNLLTPLDYKDAHLPARWSFLANSRRDLSMADGDKKSPRSRVMYASTRVTPTSLELNWTLEGSVSSTCLVLF